MGSRNFFFFFFLGSDLIFREDKKKRLHRLISSFRSDFVINLTPFVRCSTRNTPGVCLGVCVFPCDGRVQLRDVQIMYTLDCLPSTSWIYSMFKAQMHLSSDRPLPKS